MADIQSKLQKRNSRLSEIDAALERQHRKLLRTVNAIDKLRKERKRLLAPRKLESHELNGTMDDREWHKIREQDFGDEIPDFLVRQS